MLDLKKLGEILEDESLKESSRKINICDVLDSAISTIRSLSEIKQGMTAEEIDALKYMAHSKISIFMLEELRNSAIALVKSMDNGNEFLALELLRSYTIK
jgi:hypothetical protein